ncbi:hypothetical protein PQX77_010655 [Marasmius sp. AFHP31]|nr:hypothetical protein PQX77_010655 [Marasmius sp. AFHP31]
MFPKLIALDTEQGPKAAHKLADNIHKVDELTLEDGSDHDNKVKNESRRHSQDRHRYPQ